MGSRISSLKVLESEIAECERCTRLREHCRTIGETKRRAYLDQDYWAKPVPSFGPAEARVLLLGLAPGAHGSNRTGRPFTGDGSGGFLYPLLYETGFASMPQATSRTDGMRLTEMRITSVVRCAPPGNKPLPTELANCAPYLDAEIAAMRRLRVVVCLGRIAFDGFVAHLIRTGQRARRGELQFAHGAEFKLPDGRWLLGCYHPSLQNTNTGKLTRPMMLRVFLRARELAGVDG